MRSSICFLLVFYSTVALSQVKLDGWYYFENVATGELLEVRGGTKQAGTEVHPRPLNFTEAQMFNIVQAYAPDFGEEVVYNIRSEDESGQLHRLQLSVQQREAVVAQPDPVPPPANQINQPSAIDLPSVAAGEHSGGDGTSNVLGGWGLTIEKTIYYSASERRRLATLTRPRQVWRLTKREGTENTYFLESAHFDNRHVLQITGNGDDRVVALATFTGGSAQQWRIRSTRPNRPDDFQVTNLQWFDTKVTGTARWTANNQAADLSKVGLSFVARTTFNYGELSLAPPTTVHDFDLPFDREFAAEDHCLRVINYSKWVSHNTSGSEWKCSTPDLPDPNPSPEGVCRILVRNCDVDKRTIRLWLADLTVDPQGWSDKGTIGSQDGTDGCPTTAAVPVEIPLGTDHIYQLVAIPLNCGSLDPAQTNGSCFVSQVLIQGTDAPNGLTLNTTIASANFYTPGCQ